jgi:integrase
MPVRRRTDNGNWLVDFRVGGKRIRETYPAHIGKREIETLERRRRAEVEAEGVGSADGWGAVAARYWLENGQHLAWQASVKGHLDALSDLIGDGTPVRAITPDTFARGVALWRQQIAPATVNRRLAVARGLWGVANELWGLRMPAIPWRRLQLPEPDRGDPPYIPPAVREAIMAKAPPHIVLAMRLALATGWRRASVLGLRWEHIDWARELIHGWGKGKGGGVALVHPLTAELRAILAEAAPDGPPGAGPIVAWRGKPVLDTKKGFDRARLEAGYPEVLFRDLRHSVAQEILAATGSLDLAGAALGHRQVSTTRKHYARVQVDAIRAALEARTAGLGHRSGHSGEIGEAETRGKSGASNGSRTRDLQSHNLAL